MANTNLWYQLSGPVAQALIDTIQASHDAQLPLLNHWAGLNIATAEDVDGTLDFVGALTGFPRPLVSNVFFSTYMFIFTDAALPSSISFDYGLNDAEQVANGDCESATDPLLVTDPGTVAFKSGATWAQDSTHAHGGTYARKLTKTAGVGTAGWADFTSVDTGLNGLSPGDTYTHTLRLYIPIGQAGLTPSTMLRILTDDGLGGSLVRYAADTYDAWQQVTVTGVLDAGATKATPRVQFDPAAPTSAACWVDDVAWSSPLGGALDDSNPGSTNIMPELWYRQLLPLVAQIRRGGLGIGGVDLLAAWADTVGGGTGYTIVRDSNRNIQVVFTTFIDPRALFVCNMIVGELETLPLITFQES